MWRKRLIQRAQELRNGGAGCGRTRHRRRAGSKGRGAGTRANRSRRRRRRSRWRRSSLQVRVAERSQQLREAGTAGRCSRRLRSRRCRLRCRRSRCGRRAGWLFAGVFRCRGKCAEHGCHAAISGRVRGVCPVTMSNIVAIEKGIRLHVRRSVGQGLRIENTPVACLTPFRKVLSIRLQFQLLSVACFVKLWALPRPRGLVLNRHSD